MIRLYVFVLIFRKKMIDPFLRIFFVIIFCDEEISTNYRYQ